MNFINFIKNNFTSAIIIITLFLGFHYFYFKLNFDNNQKFKNLIGTYASLSIILTIYTIYKNSQINYSNIINMELNSLNLIFQNIIEKCNSFFIANPNMKYYYNELFNGINNEDEQIRNKDLEQILSNSLLNYIDAFINYVDAYKIANGPNFQLELMEKKLLRILKQFVKSKIFLENWYIFKEKYALDWTKTYFQIYLNH